MLEKSCVVKSRAVQFREVKKAMTSSALSLLTYFNEAIKTVTRTAISFLLTEKGVAIKSGAQLGTVRKVGKSALILEKKALIVPIFVLNFPFKM